MDNSKVDLHKLKNSKELSTSIEDDKRHRQIDAAKKRAAAQNVDYDTFAALVSVSHLKPVDRTEVRVCKVREAVSPAWSFDSEGFWNQTDANAYSQVLIAEWPGMQNGHKMTADEFEKKWRSKYQLNEKLLLLKNACLSSVFKVSLPPYLLVDILEALCTFLDETRTYPQWRCQGECVLKRDSDMVAEHMEHTKICEDDKTNLLDQTSLARLILSLSQGKKPPISHIVSILESLSKCGRFSLSIKLIGHRGRSVASSLFGHISSIISLQLSETTTESFDIFDTTITRENAERLRLIFCGND